MNPTTNIKFNFNRNKDPDLIYRPKPVEFSLYQICQFPNPLNKKYGVRRLKINEFFEIMDVKEKDYTKKKIDKFVEKTPENKFTIYPTHNIKMVAYPNPDKIIGANSELLK
jgi:hypothetical protein